MQVQPNQYTAYYLKQVEENNRRKFIFQISNLAYFVKYEYCHELP